MCGNFITCYTQGDELVHVQRYEKLHRPAIPLHLKECRPHARWFFTVVRLVTKPDSVLPLKCGEDLSCSIRAVVVVNIDRFVAEQRSVVMHPIRHDVCLVVDHRCKNRIPATCGI